MVTSAVTQISAISSAARWRVPATSAAAGKRHRLLVMSNRTPSAAPERTREVGGLVSVLDAALRDEHGVWLGWSGQVHDDARDLVIEGAAQPVHARFDLPRAARERFYAGFCNSVLWPLFHGFASRVRGGDADWDAYVDANERYARHALELTQRDATIWVHDYHLLLTARMLRALGHHGPIGLFLHIPFPIRELVASVPWGRELVDAMLAFDLVGFQTDESARNFVTAARMVPGTSCAVRAVQRGDHTTNVGVFPATICPEPFRAPADDPGSDQADDPGGEAPEIAGLRQILGDRRLILSVDRLDYTKGIPERLAAYEQMLDQFPAWRRRVTFLQIAVPSRTDIWDYDELRRTVEGLVGRINGRFGDIDWVPVRYLSRAYERDLLARLYRLADVALVTPLRDGMNLVAKEFVLAQDPARPGVLVLSPYAGAADTLTSALFANPFDPAGFARAIDRALREPLAERIERSRKLVASLEREGDARSWARAFLDRLAQAREVPRGDVHSLHGTPDAARSGEPLVAVPDLAR